MTDRIIIPMNKWVLFGHHFAAIAGAGPLVGPVLAAQFGFMPGFLVDAYWCSNGRLQFMILLYLLHLFSMMENHLQQLPKLKSIK